ncbi:hypothetical protein [Larsenimonas suaedae]|uniref:Lipoprotein n=1 Tax=Larsenimonas suaedae TaxID=1851019 RepID=A0ABU1GSG7_9GAMM|nr:hypothetical protein [Larsenimonas suaedae]MCM2972243.1 hypothetical protein [Larsenimonas suaedae]MDR5894961.1 hypothetical protein [Larsenimonas suaedae]
MRLRWLVLVLVLTVSGCSLFSSSPTFRERDPLNGLGRQAALTLERTPLWQKGAAQPVLVVPPTTIDHHFPTPVGHFRDALARALLAKSETLQVIAWPGPAPRPTQANQWLLETSLEARAPLSLSDRTLYPYTLTMRLYQSGQDAPVWQTRSSGAFDEQALNTTRRY